MIAFGLVVLYSALGQAISAFSMGRLCGYCSRSAIMVVAAQFEPGVYLRWTPVLYGVGMVMLIAVKFLRRHRQRLSALA